MKLAYDRVLLAQVEILKAKDKVAEDMKTDNPALDEIYLAKIHLLDNILKEINNYLHFQYDDYRNEKEIEKYV